MDGFVGGLAHIQFWRADALGRMCGTEVDPANIAAGTTTHAHYVEGAVELDPGRSDRVRVPLRSGDRVVGHFIFGNEGFQGSLSLEKVDEILDRMAEGGNLDQTTVSGWDIWGANDQNPSPNLLGCCLSQQWQDPELGTDSALYWLNRFYLCRLSPGSPPAKYQDKGEQKLGLSMIPLKRFPHGVPFGAAQGFTKNMTSELRILADSPLALTTYVAADAGTTFTLAYLPLSAVVTLATEPNYLARNNVEEAPVSIDTGTGVVTIASSTASDFVSLLYATSFTPSS
jgi:hypothetical protein